MRIPRELQPLIGFIDEVLRALKSGKEVSVYTVRAGGQVLCGKVYKNMAQRTFQARAQYQEGRKVRCSRQARAVGRASKFGRRQQGGRLEERRGGRALSALRHQGSHAPAARLFARRAADGPGHR
jgi:RIO kinase 1